MIFFLRRPSSLLKLFFAVGWMTVPELLPALDRLTFDDERTHSVTIIRQSRDRITFIDAEGKTNTLFKAEIKRIEPGFGEDRFYEAAVEETNAEKKINLLRRSVERFPRETKNHDLLIRVLLSRSETQAARNLLSQPHLRGAPFHLLHSLYFVKSGNLLLARSHLDRAVPRAGQTNLRVELKILRSLLSGLENQITVSRENLRQLEKEFGHQAAMDGYRRLYLHDDYRHFKKTVESLDLLRENGLRFEGRSADYFGRYGVFGNPTNHTLENKNITLPAPGVLPRRTLQGLAAGTLALGISSALGWTFAAVEFHQLQSRYEGALFPGQFGSGSGALYERWSGSRDMANARMAMTSGLTLLGTALTLYAGLDPFKAFDEKKWARPENHFLISEAAPDSAEKVFFGHLGIFFLALTPDLAFQWITGWVSYDAARKAYDANTDAALFANLGTDLDREGARANVAFYALLGSAVLGTGSLILAALNPFGKSGKTEASKKRISTVWFPLWSGDRFEIRCVGIF